MLGLSLTCFNIFWVPSGSSSVVASWTFAVAELLPDRSTNRMRNN
jgi:hypothetical protein